MSILIIKACENAWTRGGHIIFYFYIGINDRKIRWPFYEAQKVTVGFFFSLYVGAVVII